jgi:DNA-binding response OmpR family regulator
MRAVERPRVFVAADARAMRRTLTAALQEDAARYLVLARATSGECLGELAAFQPHVVLLDLGPLSGPARVDLLRRVRESLMPPEASVLAIIGAGRVADAEALLRLGVESVILNDELTADGLRVRTRLALARRGAHHDSQLVYGAFRVRPTSCAVTFRRKNVTLRGDHFQTLWKLLAAAGEAVGYRDLLGCDADVPREAARRAAKSRVYRLRRRLGAGGKRIESVPGIGYRIRT